MFKELLLEIDSEVREKDGVFIFLQFIFSNLQITETLNQKHTINEQIGIKKAIKILPREFSSVKK